MLSSHRPGASWISSLGTTTSVLVTAFTAATGLRTRTGRLEDVPQQQVAPPSGLVQLLTRVPVVAVVGEVAGRGIEFVRPVDLGARRVQHHDLDRVLRDASLEPEAALVAHGHEASDRIVRRILLVATGVHPLQDEIGARQLGECHAPVCHGETLAGAEIPRTCVGQPEGSGHTEVQTCAGLAVVVYEQPSVPQDAASALTGSPVSGTDVGCASAHTCPRICSNAAAGCAPETP